MKGSYNANTVHTSVGTLSLIVLILAYNNVQSESRESIFRLWIKPLKKKNKGGEENEGGSEVEEEEKKK